MAGTPEETALADAVDLPAVAAWLEREVPACPRPVAAQLIAGGRSNLTFALRDAAGGRVILRRPPVGEVLESAHDMAREHRILSALAGTAVPVPQPLGLCEDPGVIGAPFYVMSFVDGVVVRDQDDAERLLEEPARSRASDAVVDVLADLHALDPEAVGLGSLGRHDGYVERQLRRWQRQWTRSRSFDVPAIDEAHARLSDRVPPQQRVAIVHGDYRIDNLVLARDGSVAAVLDWELCTLGDPLADLGGLLVAWIEPGEDARHMLIGTPTVAPGFRSRAEVLERYARRTGLDVGDTDFYVAFSLWKLACIAAGIHARLRAGAMGPTEPGALERLELQTRLLAERALDVLEGHDSERGGSR